MLVKHLPEMQAYTGLTVAGLCCLSAPYDTSHTAIQEKLAAYFIIGLTIPLRNANRLRLAALSATGTPRPAPASAR